jgi:hypothetical protein
LKMNMIYYDPIGSKTNHKWAKGQNKHLY